jgi:nucleoside phosphorylase
MSDSDKEAEIKALEDRLAELKRKTGSYQAKLHGDGAIAQGNGAVAVGKGGIIAGRDINNNLINTGTINVSYPKAHSGSEPDSAGILIAVVTKVEVQAVLKAFDVETSQARQTINHKIYYNLGSPSGAPLWLVQSEMGSTTPGGALVTIRQAIQDLHPQAVVMCGIAYGLRPNKQTLGDILIAKQLEYYEPQKVDLKSGGAIPRGDRTTASERLLSLFRGADNVWSGARTHFGLVLSGEKLVNDPTFRDWLLKAEPEAIGGEMEGAGLYAAARDAKVDWILVKGICDWADGEKNDKAQALAAENAARFVKCALEMG